MSLSFYDDFLYAVVGIETDGVTRLYLQKVAANDENEFIPRLDNRVKFTVTEDNTTGKRAARRKSFCARSAGQMKKFPKAAKNPNSRLRQARKRWKC